LLEVTPPNVFDCIAQVESHVPRDLDALDA